MEQKNRAQAIGEEFAAYAIGHMPISALGDLVATSLDPRVADQRMWDALLRAGGKRLERAAQQFAAFSTDTDSDGSESCSQAMRRRVDAFTQALEAPEPWKEEAQRRFAQTFGSAEWIGWIREGLFEGERGPSLFGKSLHFAARFAQELFERIERPAPAALVPFAEILIDSALENLEPRASVGWMQELDAYLGECDRVGLAQSALTPERAARVAAVSAGPEGDNLLGRSRALLDAALLRGALAQAGLEASAPAAVSKTTLRL